MVRDQSALYTHQCPRARDMQLAQGRCRTWKRLSTREEKKSKARKMSSTRKRGHAREAVAQLVHRVREMSSTRGMKRNREDLSTRDPMNDRFRAKTTRHTQCPRRLLGQTRHTRGFYRLLGMSHRARIVWSRFDVHLQKNLP